MECQMIDQYLCF